MFSSEGVACLSSTGIFKHCEFCAGLEHETINGITGTSPLTSTFLKAACHYHSLKIEVCELLAMGYSLSGGSYRVATVPKSGFEAGYFVYQRVLHRALLCKQNIVKH